MNRAITVAIVAAITLISFGCGSGSEPRRPERETPRDAPGKVENSGYKPGTQPQPEGTPPAGK